jgi:hypothetical protein
MSARLRRPLLLVPLALLWLAAGSAPVGASSTFSRDLYFDGSWEHQVDSRTCTAASVAIMENLIARGDLNLNQMTILRYEQPRDALNDSVQRGSDPLGWSRAATYFSQSTPSPTSYRWEAYATKRAALQRAALQLTLTGKPVGFLVLHGQHAVVMTGFASSGNPRSGTFTVMNVAISDPDGSRHSWYTAGTSPLNTYLETDATATYDKAWYGKYVIVVPLS